MPHECRVLFVDGDPDELARTLQFLKTEENFAVECVCSGEDALDRLASAPFDVVVSEYTLPGMNGLLLLETIRMTRKTLPFIIFTGHGSEDAAIESVNHGVDFYLRRSTDLPSLYATLAQEIRIAVERYHAKRALREIGETCRLTMDATNDGIWDWDIPSGEVFYSPRWFTIIGYAPGEFPGTYTTWQSLIHPDDRMPAEEKIHSHLAHGDGSYATEIRMRTKQGDWKWILARGKVVERDARGRARRMVGTHTDIDERKRAETALRESEARLSLSLEVGNAGLWEWDLASDQVFFNPQFHALLGYTPGDLPHDLQPWLTYHHPDDLPDMLSRAKAFLNGDSPVYESEHRIRTKNGDWAWVFTRGRIVDSKTGGSTKRFLGFAINSTERKRIQSELEQKNRELNASYEQLAASEEELKGQYDALFESEREMRLSEDRLLMAQNIGHSGCWEYLFETNRIWGSAEGLNIFGFPAVAGIFSLEDIEACIPERVRVHKALIDLIQKGREYNLEYAINPADGSDAKMIHSVARLENDGEGRPMRVIGVIQDITECKRTEDTLVRVNRKLSVLNDLTRKDLASHLFVLRSYLELSRNHARDTDKDPGTLQKMEHQLQSISAIVEFSKDYQTMGKNPPKWQNVKLVFLMGLSHVTMGEIQTSIETEYLEIFADPLLEKAFQGLFENTLAHGRHARRIRVSCTENSGETILVFEDDGAGILPDAKDHLFLRGEGIRASIRGLFFIREILDITGMTIEETGEPGRGARFEITVPRGVYRFGTTGKTR